MSAQESAAPATVVIVTHQSARTLSRTLAAARRCEEARLTTTVIVDNCSTDATKDIIAREAPWAQVHLSERNNGFGRGCNLGFAQVATPYTAFINPDAVVEPDALHTLLTFLDQNPRAGIVGPAIIEGADGVRGELQVTGDRPTPLTILRAALPRARSLLRPIVPGSPAQLTGWVCGAVLVIRSSLMRQLDGFDPRFFLYWEEMDLCRRAESLGMQTWALGEALARHVGGASSAPDSIHVSGCIASHYFQSRYHYLRKHHGHAAAASVEWGEFLMLAMRAGIDAVRGRGWRRLRPRLQAPLMSLPKEES